MIIIKKQKGESEDHLIARFRKKILYEKVIPDFRERERHKKKSEQRKERNYRVAHLRELEKKRSV
ncbi:MAG: 30S ribosomal protein S21 [Candidatus Woesebacteria bacterium]|nr:MAG: 30S ribosomal protein S21 [Candidatus Woesebacteria bacterium]